MSTSTFFEYLNAHESTADLAAELSEALTTRVRRSAAVTTAEDVR